MDESFPAKHFKSNKIINRAMSRSEPTLHISEQFVGFKIPDKPTVNRSFHCFTDATCQRNRTIIGRICCILTRLWNRNDNYFPPIQILLKIFKRSNREELCLKMNFMFCLYVHCIAI